MSLLALVCLNRCWKGVKCRVILTDAYDSLASMNPACAACVLKAMT